MWISRVTFTIMNEKSTQLIRLYFYICDGDTTDIFSNCQRFSNNRQVPAFTDEELLTAYLFAIIELQGADMKQVYAFIRDYWLSWFPELPSYQAFNRRLNNLISVYSALISKSIAHICLNHEANEAQPLLLDSCPIVLCKGYRKPKLVIEDSCKGYNATKKMFYHGVKLHILARKQPNALPIPVILGHTPANVHDLTAAKPVLETLHGATVWADKAYLCSTLEKNMQANKSCLITPERNNKGTPEVIKQHDHAAKALEASAIAKVRQPIEALFSWLNDKLRLQNGAKIRSANGLITHIYARLAAALLLLGPLA